MLELQIGEVILRACNRKIKIRTKESFDKRNSFNKTYFNKVDILKEFKSKKIATILLLCDKTEFKGYINLGDFINVANRTGDALFYLDVQRKYVKQTSDSSKLGLLNKLETISGIVSDDKAYDQFRNEVGFYDMLQQDLLHEYEINDMNNKEVEQWIKLFGNMRKERRKAKEEVHYREVIRSNILLKKENIGQVRRALEQPKSYYVNKVYNPRICKEARIAWENKILDKKEEINDNSRIETESCK